MRYLQGKSITGYMIFRIEGHQPELFFQYCVEQNIQVWNIAKLNETMCEGTVRHYDFKHLINISNRTDYKIEPISQHGLPNIVMQAKSNLHIIIACVLSIMFLIILSQFIWKIEVTG